MLRKRLALLLTVSMIFTMIPTVPTFAEEAPASQIVEETTLEEEAAPEAVVEEKAEASVVKETAEEIVVEETDSVETEAEKLSDISEGIEADTVDAEEDTVLAEEDELLQSSYLVDAESTIGEGTYAFGFAEEKKPLSEIIEGMKINGATAIGEYMKSVNRVTITGDTDFWLAKTLNDSSKPSSIASLSNADCYVCFTCTGTVDTSHTATLSYYFGDHDKKEIGLSFGGVAELYIAGLPVYVSTTSETVSVIDAATSEIGTGKITVYHNPYGYTYSSSGWATESSYDVTKDKRLYTYVVELDGYENIDGDGNSIVNTDSTKAGTENTAIAYMWNQNDRVEDLLKTVGATSIDSDWKLPVKEMGRYLIVYNKDDNKPSKLHGVNTGTVIYGAVQNYPGSGYAPTLYLNGKITIGDDVSTKRPLYGISGFGASYLRSGSGDIPGMQGNVNVTINANNGIKTKIIAIDEANTSKSCDVTINAQDKGLWSEDDSNSVNLVLFSGGANCTINVQNNNGTGIWAETGLKIGGTGLNITVNATGSKARGIVVGEDANEAYSGKATISDVTLNVTSDDTAIQANYGLGLLKIKDGAQITVSSQKNSGDNNAVDVTNFEMGGTSKLNISQVGTDPSYSTALEVKTATISDTAELNIGAENSRVSGMGVHVNTDNEGSFAVGENATVKVFSVKNGFSFNKNTTLHLFGESKAESKTRDTENTKGSILVDASASNANAFSYNSAAEVKTPDYSGLRGADYNLTVSKGSDSNYVNPAFYKKKETYEAKRVKIFDDQDADGKSSGYANDPRYYAIRLEQAADAGFVSVLKWDYLDNPNALKWLAKIDKESDKAPEDKNIIFINRWAYDNTFKPKDEYDTVSAAIDNNAEDGNEWYPYMEGMNLEINATNYDGKGDFKDIIDRYHVYSFGKDGATSFNPLQKDYYRSEFIGEAGVPAKATLSLAEYGKKYQWTRRNEGTMATPTETDRNAHSVIRVEALYKLWVGGHQVTSDIKDDVIYSLEGKQRFAVGYQPEINGEYANKLVLINYEYDGSGKAMIHATASTAPDADSMQCTESNAPIPPEGPAALADVFSGQYGIAYVGGYDFNIETFGVNNVIGVANTDGGSDLNKERDIAAAIYVKGDLNLKGSGGLSARVGVGNKESFGLRVASFSDAYPGNLTNAMQKSLKAHGNTSLADVVNAAICADGTFTNKGETIAQTFKAGDVAYAVCAENIINDNSIDALVNERANKAYGVFALASISNTGTIKSTIQNSVSFGTFVTGVMAQNGKLFNDKKAVIDVSIGDGVETENPGMTSGLTGVAAKNLENAGKITVDYGKNVNASEGNGFGAGIFTFEDTDNSGNIEVKLDGQMYANEVDGIYAGRDVINHDGGIFTFMPLRKIVAKKIHGIHANKDVTDSNAEIRVSISTASGSEAEELSGILATNNVKLNSSDVELGIGGAGKITGIKAENVRASGSEVNVIASRATDSFAGIESDYDTEITNHSDISIAAFGPDVLSTLTPKRMAGIKAGEDITVSDSELNVLINPDMIPLWSESATVEKVTALIAGKKLSIDNSNVKAEADKGSVETKVLAAKDIEITNTIATLSSIMNNGMAEGVAARGTDAIATISNTELNLKVSSAGEGFVNGIHTDNLFATGSDIDILASGAGDVDGIEARIAEFNGGENLNVEVHGGTQAAAIGSGETTIRGTNDVVLTAGASEEYSQGIAGNIADISNVQNLKITAGDAKYSEAINTKDGLAITKVANAEICSGDATDDSKAITAEVGSVVITNVNGKITSGNATDSSAAITANEVSLENMNAEITSGEGKTSTAVQSTGKATLSGVQGKIAAGNAEDASVAVQAGDTLLLDGVSASIAAGDAGEYSVAVLAEEATLSNISANITAGDAGESSVAVQTENTLMLNDVDEDVAITAGNASSSIALKSTNGDVVLNGVKGKISSGNATESDAVYAGEEISFGSDVTAIFHAPAGKGIFNKVPVLPTDKAKVIAANNPSYSDSMAYQPLHPTWPNYATMNTAYAKAYVKFDYSPEQAALRIGKADGFNYQEFFAPIYGDGMITMPTVSRTGYTLNGYAKTADSVLTNFKAGQSVKFEDLGEEATVYAVWTENRPTPGPQGGGGSVKKAQPAGSVIGNWLYHPEINKWTFTSLDNTHLYKSEWAYVFNPYAQGNQPVVSWFYFDENGFMLTGWHWIKSVIDGNTYCYYFHEISDNCLGMLYVNTVVGGKFQVNGDGHWVVDGIDQKR